MNKKIVATLLVSTVVLTQIGHVAVVNANETDSKIAAQDQKINAIAQQQASAQAQVDALQAKVDAIHAEQANLNAENARLEEESNALRLEIERLSADIVSRNDVLKEQARSAQVDGSAASYINTVLDSKSLVDAVMRVNAMREIVAANQRMLSQQKQDKEKIAEKQIANQEAINTVIANKQKLDDAAQELKTQEASLKAAQLNLAAEKATAENEKAALLQQKAAAEEAAKKAAAEQAAYQARQAQISQLQNQAVSPVVSPTGTFVPATATSTAGNSYPVGQCTWGAKALAPWVGNNWGNANMWIASARAAGHSVGSTPVVGAVAVWANDPYAGGYGHVAVVTAVQSGTSIRVSEANYLGNPTIGDYRGWFDPTAGLGGVVYIYP